MIIVNRSDLENEGSFIFIYLTPRGLLATLA